MILKEYGSTEIAQQSETQSHSEEKEYEEVYVNEEQAGELIEDFAYALENGLVCLDQQIVTDGEKRVETIFADSRGSLVIALTKLDEMDSMLSQSLSFYNNVIRNIDSYSRIFNERLPDKFIDPARRPRLFLISPSIDFDLMEKCRWLDIEVSVFAVKFIRHCESGTILPIFTKVPIPEIPKTLNSAELEEATIAKEEAAESEESDKDTEEKEDSMKLNIYFDGIGYAPASGDYDNQETAAEEATIQEEEMEKL